MEHFAGCEMQRSSQIGLLIFAWRHDLGLRAVRHPRRPDLGQEVKGVALLLYCLKSWFFSDLCGSPVQSTLRSSDEFQGWPRHRHL